MELSKLSQTSCKTQLSVYAQKRGKVLPLYRHSQEGPSHAPQFMAEVTIDGQTFQSQDYYRTLRDAEAAAAAVALNSLPPIPPQQSSFRSYKNLLQEMAQKQAIPLPVYNTTTYNSDYSAAFKSSVLFKGKTFDGEPGTKKKQAEMNDVYILIINCHAPWTNIQRKLRRNFLKILVYAMDVVSYPCAYI